MRSAVLASVGLHLAAIIMVIAGLPALLSPDPLKNVPIAVEVVTLDDKVRAKRKPKPAKPPPPKPKAAKPPPPPPKAPRALPPEPSPPEQPAEAVPVKKAAPAPKPKPPTPKPAPPEQKIAKAAPPPKPRPKRRPDEFQTLLKNLADQARNQRDKEPKPTQEVNVPEPPPQPKMSDLDRRRITATLAQMVMKQVSPCWNIPAGAKDAHRMRIGVRVSLNADGSLRGTPRLEDPSRMSRDPFYRALAESAIRALYNPRCSPLRLPADKYEIWQEISFNFDPREALDQ